MLVTLFGWSFVGYKTKTIQTVTMCRYQRMQILRSIAHDSRNTVWLLKLGGRSQADHQMRMFASMETFFNVIVINEAII